MRLASRTQSPVTPPAPTPSAPPPPTVFSSPISSTPLSYVTALRSASRTQSPVTPPPPPRTAAPPPTVFSSPTRNADTSSSCTHPPKAAKSLLSAASTEALQSLHPPDRPGLGKRGKKIKVLANHFPVQANMDMNIHRYAVSVVNSKKINRDVMNQLIQMIRETDLGNRIPAYDGDRNLFTVGPLPFESKDFGVKLDHKDEQASSSDSARKKCKPEFQVTIRYASTADLHHLQQFLSGVELDCPAQTIHALSVVLSTVPSEVYNAVGRFFFSPSWRTTSSHGAEYWEGYHQSLRPTQMGLSLNIDVSVKPFYESILVTEFIAKRFNLKFSRPLSDRDHYQVKEALKGVMVELTHRRYTSGYKVTGVSKKPLRELMITLDEKGTKKSVVQYFLEKYNIELRHLNFSVLLAGSDTEPIYLPMECCKIAAMQRYKKRLNQSQAIRTFLGPDEREDSIKQMVRDCNFNKQKLLTEFGIQVTKELALVDARVLTPPKLRYHEMGRESRVVPERGRWNMDNKKMIDGGKVQYWTCLNFSKILSTQSSSQFCRFLIRMCTELGMDFDPELLPINSAPPSQIEKALVDVHKQSMTELANKKQEGKLQLLIIILPDAKGSYGKIKRICETELGIVSQCCEPRKVSSVTSEKYYESLALKINVKVGGRNTVLNDAIEKRISPVTDIYTIILGADVSHLQSGDNSSPSLAAVVASMDWPGVTKYRGTVSAQPHRVEIIQDLYKMIRELLIAFIKLNNFEPRRIIFYRYGVSETHFPQVLLHEMDAIRNACKSLEYRYLPLVTFVVVQKRHHTRLFPLDDTSYAGLLPGTVVDTKICHPREYDFYLKSRAGIEGTCRPTHYHELYDENKFKADKLQTLTNALCYTYARCTQSVSIVPPVYYAQCLASRARHYIGGKTFEGGSVSGSGSTKLEVTLPSIKENVKEVMFYC